MFGTVGNGTYMRETMPCAVLVPPSFRMTNRSTYAKGHTKIPVSRSGVSLTARRHTGAHCMCTRARFGEESVLPPSFLRTTTTTSPCTRLVSRQRLVHVLLIAKLTDILSGSMPSHPSDAALSTRAFMMSMTVLPCTHREKMEHRQPSDGTQRGIIMSSQRRGKG